MTPDRIWHRRVPLALALTLLGLALRLYRPVAQSLWFDEAWTAYLASQPLAAIPMLMARVDTHPPLFTLLLALWARLAGGSDLALRAFSGMLGTLTVPLVYWAGRRLASTRGALLAAVLTALAPFLVYYAQEVRVYALLMPAYVILLGLLAPVLRHREASLRQGLLFGLVTSFFLLSFYSAVLPWLSAAALAALVLAGSRPALARWSAGHLVGLLPVALWLPGALQQRAALERLGAVQESLAGPLAYLSWIGHYFSAGHPALPFEHASTAWLYIGASLMAVAAGALRRPGLGLAVALPVLASLALLRAFGGSGPHARYLIWLLPAALLLAGEGLAWLGGSKGGRPLAAALLAGYLLASGLTLQRYFHEPRYARDDFRAVARELQASLGPRDLALFDYVDYAVLRYYPGPAPLLFLGPTKGLPAYLPQLAAYFPSSVIEDDPPVVLHRLEAELRPGRRVTLVSWYWIVRQDPLLEYALELAGHSEAFRQAGAHALRTYRLTAPLRLPPFEEQDVEWDQARLEGAALPTTTPAGEALPVALGWSNPGLGLGVRLTLRDGQGRELEYADAPLLASTHHQLLEVPPWAPPGTYKVGLRLYDLATLAPHSIDLARIETRLGHVQVGPPQPDLALRELPPDVTPGEARPLGGLSLLTWDVQPVDPTWGQRVEATVWLRVEDPIPGRLTLTAGGAAADLPLELGSWPEGALVRASLQLALPVEPSGRERLPLELAWRGQTLTLADLRPVASAVARADPPEHPLQARFGDFALLTGFDLEGRVFDAADPVPLTLHWQATATPPGLDLAVFTHLLDAEGRLIGQHDGVPAAGQAPVPSWVPGQTILDRHELVLSDPAFRGTARIEVGLYDPASGQRVLLPDGRDHLVLPVEIELR